MKSKILLRISAIVMLLHALGHTFGHMNWKNPVNPQQMDVVNKMQEQKFAFMGAMRSMGEYYEGYGYAGTIALLLIAVTLWVISNSANQYPKLGKQMAVILAVSLLFWGVDELIYFFPFAAAFSILSSILTSIAAWQLHKQSLKNNP